VTETGVTREKTCSTTM